MNFMLYISSLCSKKNKIANTVRELADFGFKNIELTGGTIFYGRIEQDLVKLQEEYKLDYLIHNYFPPPEENFVINIASRKTEVKEKTLKLVKEALRLSRVFGKNLYTLHPGFLNELLPELSEGFFVKHGMAFNLKEDFYRTAELFSKEVIPKNFKIGIENLGLKTKNDKFSFLCDSDDIENFLAYFKNNESVGILLDLGHLNVSARILRFDRDSFLDRIADNYGEKVFAFHLSGNDGCMDSHTVLPVDSWQIKYLIKYRKVFTGRPVVFEWHNAASKETYENFTIIKDALN